MLSGSDGRRDEAYDASFEPDANDAGNLTRQRWRLRDLPSLTVDFLIPPSREGDRGGWIRHIERDFAALIAPGLSLAYRDRIEVYLVAVRRGLPLSGPESW